MLPIEKKAAVGVIVSMIRKRVSLSGEGSENGEISRPAFGRNKSVHRSGSIDDIVVSALSCVPVGEVSFGPALRTVLSLEPTDISK